MFCISTTFGKKRGLVTLVEVKPHQDVEDLPDNNKTVSTDQAVAGNCFHWQQLLNPIIVW